jgi:hypothetical protein
MSAAAFSVADWKPSDQRIWRGSYDENDSRAQVAMPTGGDTKSALTFIDVYVLGLKKWANESKQRGRAHSITHNMIAVAETLLRRCTDFKTGRCTPCIETIMGKTGFARPTVISHLAKLRDQGMLDWVRRTVRTTGGEGPRIAQTSNAYFVDLQRLPKPVLLFLRQKLRGIIDLDAQPRMAGSPLLPPFHERMAQKLVKHAVAALCSDRRGDRKRAARARQIRATSDPHARAQLLWPHSPEMQEEWLAAVTNREAPSASSGRVPECLPKNSE